MSKVSSFEAAVIKLLNAAAISYVKEKQFKDLRNGLYRFDFYLPQKNIIIEVDGPQHFSFNKVFHKNITEFKKSQERDRRKNSYCLANNIKLYRIPYWEIEKLQSAENLFQEKFLVKSKWHLDSIKPK